ncbi:hypothetical protein H3V53_11860 [Paraburkholderia bengalensis]|uniref:Uncharacterized protein n=1 Tax=Paraburkholderia bengalensis TaxID=2747562 RepID=A0ABU8IQS3_9BURK
MTTRVPVELEENKLWIEEETWNDVLVDKGVSGLSNVALAAVDIIKRDGAFIVYHEEKGIMRHIHRMSDLEKYVQEINQHRATLGLDQLDM